MIRKINQRLFHIIIYILIVVLILFTSFFLFEKVISKIVYKNYSYEDFKVSSSWKEDAIKTIVGDIYVSTKGSDDNNGSIESPVRTIEKAISLVDTFERSNKVNITVCIEEGTYYVNSLNFKKLKNKTSIRYIGIGEVIINGGISLDLEDFTHVSNYSNLEERIKIENKENIYVLDLKKEPYSLTSEDWGKMYSIGTYNINPLEAGPMYSELFINDVRQNLARYPNSGYLYTEEIIEGKENLKEPLCSGDVYKVNNELASRISEWKDLNNVWMYGFWKYDWADGSTRIGNFNVENNYLTTADKSFFGTKVGSPYYFYNCLEELDTQGEWYLDRENGLLCIYKTKDLESADINLTLSEQPVLNINSDDITFENLIIKGTRNTGIVGNGNNISIINCKVKCIGGTGIIINGKNNKIIKNEVAYTGKGGIAITGGNYKTLDDGNNIVDNNLIHDWSEVYKIYQAGIDISGVGNICSHNELFNSPHLGITYSGNNNIFEYNLIYNVCLETSDAGAIYAGRSWTSYGNHIRYNLIHSIGSKAHNPNGIYMDDAFSGQHIYNNILIDIPKYAIFIGGGRDFNIYNNLIINPGEYGIRYDARAKDAIVSNTWFTEDLEGLFNNIKHSYWKSKIWQSEFPEYKDISLDFSDIDKNCFIANPANSKIYNNKVFSKNGSFGKVDKSIYEYSMIYNNFAYTLFQKEIFKNEIFKSEIKKDLNYEQIGRY